MLMWCELYGHIIAIVFILNCTEDRGSYGVVNQLVLTQYIQSSNRVGLCTDVIIEENCYRFYSYVMYFLCSVI